MVRPKLFAAAVTLYSIVCAAEGLASPNLAGAYISNLPGVSVEYLIVRASGQRAAGNLETVTVSKIAPDGQVRTQTSATSDAETLVFGSRTARASAGGYIVTSTSPDGRIVERRFIRTSIENINAAIVALSASVNRKRVASDRKAAVALLRTYSAMSADDARRLAQAELSVDGAATALNVAQSAADRLAAIARQARAGANAKIDESGVSLAQNENREAAMRLAADADQNADAAQRQADLAGLALAAATGDVRVIRERIALVAQRTHALAAQATGDTSEGR